MPQPASKVKWNGNYVFGNETLTDRPELGSIVAAVIAGWSSTEAHLGRTFATLIGSKQPVTMAMYAAVRSFAIQREFLRVAASDILPQRYATLFDAALIVLGRAAEDRHKFAHWIWGASTDPQLQALLLVDPRDFWNLVMAQVKQWTTRRGKKTIEHLGPYEFSRSQPKLNHEHLLVYRLKDLQDAKDRVDRAYRIADALRQLAAAKSNRRRIIYRWICDEDDIHQVLKKAKKEKAHRRPESSRLRLSSPPRKRLRREEK